MKLYDGCYGVLNNGEVVGPMRDTKSGSDWPFECGEQSWRECGAYVLMLDNPLSFRSVHPTREEAEAAARGEDCAFDKAAPLEPYKPKRKPRTYRFCHLIAAFLLGVAVMAFFACTSPTEPAPHCQYQEHTFSHDSGLDTVICLDSLAYGRG